MRAPLALSILGFALLLVLLAPAASAGSAPGTAPAQVSLILPSSATVGTDTTLMGVLQNASSGQGISGATLAFSVQTTFGWLPLGNATTNADGPATVDWRPTEGGTAVLQVSFGGDPTYAAVNATSSFTVRPGAGSSPPGLSPDTVIVLIILAAVGGIWATYGFVAWQVLSIRADTPERTRAVRGSRSRSGVKGSMAEASGEASKSVPTSPSGASRAALGVAVAALVLAGIGMAFAASGAASPKAPAYTPTTVNLQMTVVPDLQGSGWDVFVPDELVVHQGDTVFLTIYNADTVEHGIHIAEFGVEQTIPAALDDNGTVTPSRTTVQFTADHAGTFGINCNVVCGAGHDEMTATLEVLPD